MEHSEYFNKGTDLYMCYLIRQIMITFTIHRAKLYIHTNNEESVKRKFRKIP